jgi:hypothetical protein
MGDFVWDADYPPPDWNPVITFTKPFLHAANQVFVYGNDEGIAIIERTQAQLDDANAIEDWPRCLAAQRQAVAKGHSARPRTARLDVGPGSAARPKGTSQ